MPDISQNEEDGYVTCTVCSEVPLRVEHREPIMRDGRRAVGKPQPSCCWNRFCLFFCLVLFCKFADTEGRVSHSSRRILNPFAL